MKEFILDNEIKLIGEKRSGHITSFCIGFNAGAIEEIDFNEGVAHAVEHMVFKGTVNRTERQINSEMDECFGFTNAMTNYPYVIYYGTVNSEDFEEGFRLYSDVLLNPTFPAEGFQEEMKVITEELRDWREDLSQRCEDILFLNAFSNRRIKELIIGNEDSLDRITLKELKSFYNRYYCPGNCVISVVTSLELENIFNIVNEVFGCWKREGTPRREISYEKNKTGVFFNEGNIQGAKIQFCYSIDDLNWREITALNYFNIIFGEGTSSILYDEIRTSKGLAYEVSSSIKNERGIKVYSIYISTSKENIEEAINSVLACIEKARSYNWEDEENINKIKKRLGLKESLALERSIELCKRITTHALMYGDYKKGFSNIDKFSISWQDIFKIINKVFKEPSIQIFSASEGVLTDGKTMDVETNKYGY